MSFRLLRLDSDPFPVSPEEYQLVKDTGVDDWIEIPGCDPGQILAAQPDAISITSGYLHRSTILELQHCRAIMRRGNGYDKIDVTAATEKGILVTNLPDFCEHELAEHSLAMLLGAARRLTQMERSLYEGTFFDKRQSVDLHRVHGSTLGIIGFGRSARLVARIANAMGMKVLDYHRHVDPQVEALYQVTPVSLDELLRESDYVMILCPLTAETRHLIGECELKLMKKTAVLINTARGAICDEPALARALQEKWIAYAAIDVYEHFNIFKRPEEPVQCLYFGLDNVLLTPHLGGTSVEAGQEVLRIWLIQLQHIIAGRFPPHCVNPEARDKTAI